MPNPQATRPPVEFREIYLDNNATTRPLPAVRESVLSALGEQFGNPSSAHTTGERGRKHLRVARKAVAELISAEPDHLVFTSSGTESNNLAFYSAAANQRGARIVTTAIEHSSVIKYCEHLGDQGIEIVQLPVDRSGLVNLERLKKAIAQRPALVSIQWVNNETGVIQDLEAISAITQAHEVLLHSDACQAVGKLVVDVSRTPVDLLTLTAHKFHGPQGVGALYARDPSLLRPLLHGGSQEGGLRAGTENIAGIVGLGKAAELRQRRLYELEVQLAEQRDYFEQRVRDVVTDVDINGDVRRRVSNTTNLLFRGVDGQALVARLDQEGVRCSQSSACTNHRPEPSYVLRAMGLTEEESYSSVRFAVSEETTFEELDIAVSAIAKICDQLRTFSNHLQAPTSASVP